MKRKRRSSLKARYIFIGVLTAFAVAVLIGRLVEWQIFRSDYYDEIAAASASYTVETDGIRGEIFDKNGVPLAVNETGYKIVVNKLFMPENRLNSIEWEFVDKPGSSFAIFQLKTGPEFHYLRFASLSELRRYAKQLRSEVHQAVNESEDILFHDKPEAEQYLKAAGFNVITDPDSHFITVRNPALQEAKIILAYGDGCCWMDGCDTRGVDLMVRKEHYDLVYSAPLQDTGRKDASQILEDLYARFNLSRPVDFTGHSLSVSDVIILKQDDRVTPCQELLHGQLRL